MDFQINKRTAQGWVEQVAGRLRQLTNDLPERKMLSVDEFAERVTLCFLREMRDAAWLSEPPDAQLVIGLCMAISHACMQTIAAEGPYDSIIFDKEMVH